MVNLGIRLQHIEKLASEEAAGYYDHIWDCCCDYGLLGMRLFEQRMAANIHWLDVVPALIDKLTQTLSQTAPATSQWHTHCLDVKDLPLHQYPGRHLIIIAGVGGELMAQCVKSIEQIQYPQIAIDYVLSPVHHCYSLRQQLIELGMSLRNEVLVKENNRFYEVLSVANSASCQASKLADHATAIEPTTSPTNPINPVGELIWQANLTRSAAPSSHLKSLSPQEAREYKDKLLAHYQRMSRSAQHGAQVKKVQSIIEAYQEVIISDHTMPDHTLPD